MRDDAAMMDDPGRWPAWPLLPLKSRTRGDESGMPLLAVMVDPAGVPVGRGRRYSVFATLMFDPPAGPAGWESLPRYDYPSAAAAAADGWVVD